MLGSEWEIYIYIYIERERERERVNDKTKYWLFELDPWSYIIYIYTYF